jgi:ankyrin repeat protein
VNDSDDAGRIPLDLALETQQFNMAKSLVEHKADVDIVDTDGLTLLWKAVQRGRLNERNIRIVLEKCENVNLHEFDLFWPKHPGK